jgi:purine-nucleoside phosphorylase
MADYITSRVEWRPEVAIVCGNGLGDLGDKITQAKIFPFAEIPYFPKKPGINLKTF